MSPDGREVIGDDVLIFDGSDDHPTVEGPKFYKRNGYYYVFAPAGGVKDGWQLVLRSKNVYGPDDFRVVMDKGDSPINGPHQGGWVDDVAGNSWFVHFEDRYAYGRVVLLQPMTWGEDDWCVIGEDKNGNGCGDPVLEWTKPATNLPVVKCSPADSDEFSSHKLGLQWQWHANPQTGWYFTNPSDGTIRLNCQKQAEGWQNLWDTPNLLMQKTVAMEYTTTVKLNFKPSFEGDRTGLLVMGRSYASLDIEY